MHVYGTHLRQKPALYSAAMHKALIDNFHFILFIEFLFFYF